MDKSHKRDIIFKYFVLIFFILCFIFLYYSKSYATSSSSSVILYDDINNVTINISDLENFPSSRNKFIYAFMTNNRYTVRIYELDSDYATFKVDRYNRKYLYRYTNSNFDTIKTTQYKVYNWTNILPTNNTINISFSNYESSSNLSYTTRQYDFEDQSNIIYYTDIDIYDDNDFTTIVFGISNNIPILTPPEISTSLEDLQTLNFDYLCFATNSYYQQDVYLLVYDRTTENPQYLDGLYPYTEMLINTNSPYYQASISEQNAIYFIPIEYLGVTFEVGKEYEFRFAERVEDNQNLNSWYYNYLGDYTRFTVSSNVTQDRLAELEAREKERIRQEERQEELNAINATTNAIEEQTNVIQEQTEVNRNIFQKIGDILSYINPFSENFFGRKLVELIIDGIKSLFIPPNDFFTTYFSNLQTWFSDRFGFLFYPFELLIDILTRMLNINIGEPSFTIPNIYEPVTNSLLIQEQTFNFNDVLQNNVFNTVHNIYFIIVDASIVFGLIELIRKKLEEVETK